MGDWYILKDGKPEPVDMFTGAQWMEENPHAVRVMARTELPDGAVLSTVFLCLDHGFPGEGVALFESMWFGGLLDGQQQRYATREEADLGHQEMLAAYPGSAEGE